MFNLDTSKRLVVLSAEQADKNHAFNANASAELATRLAQFLITGAIDSIVQCDGQYKGTPERSFLVICDADAVAALATTGAQFDQECILVGFPVSAGWITGFLRYPDGTPDLNIGTLKLCEVGRDYDASTTISGTNISFHFE